MKDIAPRQRSSWESRVSWLLVSITQTNEGKVYRCDPLVEGAGVQFNFLYHQIKTIQA